MNWTCKDSCVPSYAKHMLEVNKAYWKGSPSAAEEVQGTDWICVYHGWPDNLKFVVYENIVAKGLAAKTKCPIMSVAITNNTDCKLANQTDDSFQVARRFRIEPDKKNGWLSSFRLYLTALYLSFSTYGKKKRMFRSKYRGITWGNDVHDAIVQENSVTSHGMQFDCFDINRESYFLYIKSAISIVDQAYALLKKRKPAYVITTESLHLNALFSSVASKLGAKLLICAPSGGEWTNVMQIAPGTNVLVGEMYGKQIELCAETVPLNIGADENLFVLKPKETAEQDLKVQLGLNPGRKNVFIMLHALTDIPRSGYKHYVYSEYNEWLLDTLRIIKKIPDVNWVIKDHPMSTFYRQDSYIKSVFEKNKTDNIYWCDKAVSGMQIKEIADCIVTCAGEVGLEYWAYGIPTITTADSYFCKWGISYLMKTLEEYENTLRHIERLKPPTEESMIQARRYLTAIKRLNNTADGLSRLFRNIWDRQIDRYFKGNTEMGPIDFEFCKRYTSFLKENKVEDSVIYRLENIIDMP